jgi:hypothetical protein
MKKRNAAVAAAPCDRTYTWEEVSWITGLSIQELIQICGPMEGSGAGRNTEMPQIDQRTLLRLTQAARPHVA